MIKLYSLCCVGVVSATSALAVDFQKPQLLKVGDKPITTEAPGYAAPCWADMDGDGKLDLLVGQFNRGKIKIYNGQPDGKFAAGKWLKADGKTAQVPGVW